MRSLLLIGLLVVACKPRAEPRSDPRALIGDRAILGAGIDYQADRWGDLRSMKARRDAAWKVAAKILEPIEFDNPNQPGQSIAAPKWRGWYSAKEFELILAELYRYAEDEELERKRRAHAETLATTWQKKNLSGVVDFPESLIARWPELYQKSVTEGLMAGWTKSDLEEHFAKFTTPEDHKRVGIHEQVGLSNKGLAIYSPAYITHLLKNYSDAYIKCDLEEHPWITNPEAPGRMTGENFSACFKEEFPRNAVSLKTTWMKSSQNGRQEPTPAYRTDAAGMAEVLGTVPEPGDRAAEEGTGEFASYAAFQPREHQDIYTAPLTNSDGTVTYNLVGMHMVTKEERHWLWVSLWWSPEPDTDYGADRPDFIKGVWRNYKMCVVSGSLSADAPNFEEPDPDPGSHYRQGGPQLASLAEALDAAHAASKPFTWCSNPYIELGRGNARTNCIGCHQHAGANVVNAQTFIDMCPDPNKDETDEECRERMNRYRKKFPHYGRKRIRNNFPSDYSFGFQIPDDEFRARISKVIRDEDTRWPHED